MDRKKIIQIRTSEQEKERYQELAATEGKSLAELIRYLLDREIDRKHRES